MKGELVRTQFNYQIKYEEDGIKKYLDIHPDTDTSSFEIGKEIEFNVVFNLKEGATYTSTEGWDVNPVDAIYAEVVSEWDEIEEEYMKDEYPVFGGPFTNALTPFEWLKKHYETPKRK